MLKDIVAIDTLSLVGLHTDFHEVVVLYSDIVQKKNIQ